jgi:hypothetical protein
MQLRLRFFALCFHINKRLIQILVENSVAAGRGEGMQFVVLVVIIAVQDPERSICPNSLETLSCCETSVLSFCVARSEREGWTMYVTTTVVETSMRWVLGYRFKLQQVRIDVEGRSRCRRL